jgi:response regulator RpfG family c-di-GMP phosphodiesterase
MARVLQVVDVHDALRTAHPYKPAHSYDDAIRLMLAEAKRCLWDKEIVSESIALEQPREVVA